MGLELPGALERLLNDLGFTWPEVDEQDLFELGSTWMSFGGQLGQHQQSAQTAAQQVTALNQGAAVDAFLKKWSGDNAPASVLGDAGTGVQMGGADVRRVAGRDPGVQRGHRPVHQRHHQRGRQRDHDLSRRRPVTQSTP